MSEVELKLYNNEKEKALNLIKNFWMCHNGAKVSEEEAKEELCSWIDEGHKFFFINFEGEQVGFVPLGSRGAKCDWLEDLFVLPRFQNKGIGSKAIELVENIVKEYSISLYIEAAARNESAIRLYRKLGYDCLNTITIRKDFPEEKFESVRKEMLYDMDFEIRKMK